MHWALCTQDQNPQASPELAHVRNTSDVSLGLSDGSGRRMPASARDSDHARANRKQEDLGHQAQPRVQVWWLPGPCCYSHGLALLRETPPWGFVPPGCPGSKFSSPKAQKPWSSICDQPPRRFAHLWLFRTSCASPSWLCILSASFVSTSTLWPLLPRLPGIPLIGSCRHGLPPSPAPGLCLGSWCLSDDQGGKQRTPASLEIAQRL